MSRSKNVLITVAILSLFYLGWLFAFAIDQAYYHSGFTFTLDNKGFLVTEVVPDSAAHKGGIQPGTILTHFNKIDAKDLNSLSNRDLSAFLLISTSLFRMGGHISATSDSGQSISFIVSPLPWRNRLAIFSSQVLINIVVATLFVVAGIWLLAVGKEEPAVKWFSGFAICTAIALSNSFFISYWSPTLLALRFVTVDIAGTGSIILLHGFVRRFPERTQVRISKLTVTPLIPLAIKYSLIALRVITPYGPAIYLVHLTLAVGIVVNISMLVHRYRDTTEGGRRRLRWMFTGIGLSLVPYLLYLLFNLFKSSILVSSVSVLNSVASFSILLFPVFVIIGVVRYNLFDIDRFINRFVSIFFLVFISTIVYSLVFMFFFETKLNIEMYLILLFTALVSPWAFFAFDKLVYSFLWKGRKDPAQILLEMEQELNGVVHREEIYPIVSSALVFAFDPVGLSFAKPDDGLSMEEFRYGKLTVRSGNETVGILGFPLNTSSGRDLILYVGRKRDEDIFTKRDTQLLTSAAAQIAKALDNCDLYHRLEESLANELLAQKTAILTLAKLTEYRDQETGRHLERIQDYSRLIAKKLKETGVGPDYLTDDYIEDLCISSILHDIGKVGVPDQILLKPGKLSESEFTVIKTHPVIGGRVLEDAESMNPDRSFLAMGKMVAFHHHEKWDGSGYPDGLAGEAIPLSARIVAIADVYDALRSERPYKNAMTHSDSLDIIIEGRGKHFDPIIVDAFLGIEESIRDIIR